LSNGIDAGFCHGWDGKQFHIIHDISQQHYQWTISEAVKYSQVLLMIG
jgi:hypothetical protein